jgi:hypothetical protein
MSSENHCPDVCGVPELQREVELPSMALAAGSPPFAEDAVATQPARCKTVCARAVPAAATTVSTTNNDFRIPLLF